MYTSIRYFTKEEAEALLPELEPLLAQIRREKDILDAKFKEWEETEGADKTLDAALLRGQIEFMAKNIEETIEDVQEYGCVLKDMIQGLIDFPARINGKEAYLCWKLGEPSIQFWHGLSEGFPGRKPL
jgi:hypothetical protein